MPDFEDIHRRSIYPVASHSYRDTKTFTNDLFDVIWPLVCQLVKGILIHGPPRDPDP